MQVLRAPNFASLRGINYLNNYFSKKEWFFRFVRISTFPVVVRQLRFWIFNLTLRVTKESIADLYPKLQNSYRKLWFLGGKFHLAPRSPEGVLKILEGSTPCPRAVAEAVLWREAPNRGRSGGPWARCAARGGFQNPRTGEGDLDENPGPKTRFLKKKIITSVWYTGTAAVACDTSTFGRNLRIFIPICWY